MDILWFGRRGNGKRLLQSRRQVNDATGWYALVYAPQYTPFASLSAGADESCQLSTEFISYQHQSDLLVAYRSHRRETLRKMGARHVQAKRFRLVSHWQLGPEVGHLECIIACTRSFGDVKLHATAMGVEGKSWVPGRTLRSQSSNPGFAVLVPQSGAKCMQLSVRTSSFFNLNHSASQLPDLLVLGTIHSTSPD